MYKPRIESCKLLQPMVELRIGFLIRFAFFGCCERIAKMHQKRFFLCRVHRIKKSAPRGARKSTVKKCHVNLVLCLSYSYVCSNLNPRHAGIGYFIGGKQSPPVSGQQLNPCSPISVNTSPVQHPFASGFVPSSHVIVAGASSLGCV